MLNEIQIGVEKGYDLILLIGDELGPYGVDLNDGTTLSTLLDSLAAERISASIGLWYLDAFELMAAVPSLLRLAELGKVFFLGITIQHGSERILDLMNRHYSISETMEAVRKFRKYPGMIIATQIMVGFPSEAEEDFLKNIPIIESGCFDKVEVFQ